MSVLHCLLGRRHFLATTLIGTIGAFLPAAVHADTPARAGAEAQAARGTPRPNTPPAGAAVIAGAAMAQTSDDISIRPFQFHASDEALEDLRRRIAATKWPGRELVTDASQGVQLATMQKLARYWQTDYDWRTVDLVMSGKGGATITELAATVGVSPSYFTRVFRLSFLAPEITRTILQGRQPLGLTANTLIRGGKLPSAWSDQHPAAEPRLIRTVLRLRRKQPAC